MAISMPQDFEHALASMLNGESVVIDGAPGTGKSTLLRTFMEVNDALPDSQRKRVLPVALLGRAANGISGLTIDSAFNFDPFMTLDDVLPGGKWDISGAKLLLSLVETLVIDDAHNLNTELLLMMSVALQRVRKNNEPFGGVQLIAAGELARSDSPLGSMVQEPEPDPERYVFLSFDGVSFNVSYHVVRVHAVVVERGQIVADFGTWLNPMSDLGQFGLDNEVPPGGVAIAPQLEDFWPLLLRQAAGGIVVGDRLEMAQDAGRYQARGLDMELGDGIDAEALDIVVEGSDVIERAHSMALDFLSGDVEIPYVRPVPDASDAQEGALFQPFWAPAAPLKLDQTRATDSDNAWAAFSGSGVEVSDQRMLQQTALRLSSWGMSRGVWTKRAEEEVRKRAIMTGLTQVSLPEGEEQNIDIAALLSPGMRVVFTGCREAISFYDGEEQLISACESCGLIFEDSVSATTCDVLVAWDPASMSRKARTARELGIPIVSFADFEDWYRYYTGSPYETFLADILEEGHQVAFRGSIVINGIHITDGARMAYLCDELGLVYSPEIPISLCDALITDDLTASQYGIPLIPVDAFGAWVNREFASKGQFFTEDFFIPADITALYGPDELLSKIDESKA
ncbi:AAA family ATPase [Corynebacterium sp. UMB8791]